MTAEVTWTQALECENECIACLWASAGKRFPELTAAFSKLRPVKGNELCMKCGQPFGSRAAHEAAGEWLRILKQHRAQTKQGRRR